MTYQARLGKPVLHDAYPSELTTLRDQLKAGLFRLAGQATGLPAVWGSRK